MRLLSYSIRPLISLADSTGAAYTFYFKWTHRKNHKELNKENGLVTEHALLSQSDCRDYFCQNIFYLDRDKA